MNIGQTEKTKQNGYRNQRVNLFFTVTEKEKIKKAFETNDRGLSTMIRSYVLDNVAGKEMIK